MSVKKFLDVCLSEGIFDDAKKIVVAVSGGADSLALADLLTRVRRRFNLEICIAHYEHGLRGEDSINDSEFVRGFAANLGVKFFVEHGKVREFAESKKISLETAARVLRYEFLNKVRCEENFDAIALAHHADDQAETILMRLIRGTGSAGLSAMKFRTYSKDYGLLIRPLLRFKKNELENYCGERGLFPRIDTTNFEMTMTRNRIRLEILPMLEKMNPAITDSLCRLGESAAEDFDFINSEVEKVFPKVVRNNELYREEFLKLHTALQRMVLRKFIESSVGSVKDFGFLHFEELRKVLLNNLSGVELPHKYRAELRRGKLVIGSNHRLNDDAIHQEF